MLASTRPLLFEAIRAFATLYLVAMMFTMGLELGGEAAEGKPAKRRQRRLILRALVLNLALLPLLALTLTRAIGASGDVAIAFLLLAASPGGRFAPPLARVAHARLGLSVEITLFVAKLVSFTAPPTAAWLLHRQRVEVRDLRFILQLLVLQLLPYLAGRQVRKRWQGFALRIARPVRLTSWVALALVLMLALASRQLRELVPLAGARGWWAVLSFTVIAGGLGWLVGGPASETRRALAVSVNARNLPLAMVLASLMFPADRNVHLGAFAVWLVMLLLDLAYAKLAGARRRQPAALAPTHA